MPTDLIFPTQLWPDEETVTLEDNGTFVFQPMMGAAVTQRVQGAEPKMVVRQTYTGLSADHRQQLLSFAREVQGRYKSFWLSPSRFTNVGSWVPTEVFSNGTFANAGSGWTAQSALVGAVPGGIRLRNTKANGRTNFAVYQTATVNSTDVYALRGFTERPNFANPSSAINGTYWAGFGVTYAQSYAFNAYGMQERVALASSGTVAGAFPVVIDTGGTVTRAGDYIDVQYASLARCLLVDGGQNLLKNSTNTASNWPFNNNVTVTNSAVESPMGTTTAFRMAETAVTSPSANHGVGQQATVSSLVGDHSFSASFKVGSFATHARVYLEETQLFHFTAANLEFATGSVSVSAQSNWNHARAYVTSEGNGWWRVGVSARKISSASVLTAYIFMSNTAGTYNYASNGSGFIYGADASLAASPVPVRYTATTTAAYSGETPSSDLVSLKGGPPGVQGALRAGRLIEIGGELKTLASDVDFNGLGLGVARIRPTLFRSPAIDAAVHVSRPFGRFVLRNAPDVINRLGQYVDITLEMEEVYE